MGEEPKKRCMQLNNCIAMRENVSALRSNENVVVSVSHEEKATKGVQGMPWRQVPMKGVVHCDKLRSGVCSREQPEISEWGNPAGVIPRHPVSAGREPGELKHLSSPRKGNDSASSGERKRISPNHISVWGCRTRARVMKVKWKALGNAAREGESPVDGSRIRVRVS